MNRKLVTLSLLAAPLLAPALAHAQSVVRDPKGIVAPFNGTAEEAYIKDQIRGAGYSGVNSLMRDNDGTWHARAYKGPADVLVAVDRSGHVSETAER
jgi:hypothetical protein